MDGLRHYAMFAAYNRWANARLYDAAELLSEDEWSRDVHAFFGSMQGTLNHILVAIIEINMNTIGIMSCYHSAIPQIIVELDLNAPANVF